MQILNFTLSVCSALIHFTNLILLVLNAKMMITMLCLTLAFSLFFFYQDFFPLFLFHLHLASRHKHLVYRNLFAQLISLNPCRHSTHTHIHHHIHIMVALESTRESIDAAIVSGAVITSFFLLYFKYCFMHACMHGNKYNETLTKSCVDFFRCIAFLHIRLFYLSVLGFV